LTEAEYGPVVVGLRIKPNFTHLDSLYLPPIGLEV
jgi:hypothetical protein